VCVSISGTEANHAGITGTFSVTAHGNSGYLTCVQTLKQEVKSIPT
jgi:hypothetical protein